MKRTALLVTLLMSCAPILSAATVREIPDIVTEGFSSYRALGANAGMKMWLKGSSIPLGSEIITEEMKVLASAEAGAIPRGSTVVCTVTGHGLKDPDWAIATAPAPTTIPVDPAAAARALGLA